MLTLYEYMINLPHASRLQLAGDTDTDTHDGRVRERGRSRPPAVVPRWTCTLRLYACRVVGYLRPRGDKYYVIGGEPDCEAIARCRAPGRAGEDADRAHE